MVSFTTVAFIALAYVSCLVNASPLAVRNPLDVAAPPVTYPTQGVRWVVGDTQVVTWDTSKLPAQITNPTGMVVLGWIDSTGSYNLQLKNPLATGFPITAGKVSVTVPSGYPDGNNYIVALIGSSDNISPTFTITSGGGSPSANSPNAGSNPTPTPSSQPSDTGSQPTPTTTTTSSGSPAENNAATPYPTPSTSSSSVSSSSSSSTKSSPSSTPSGSSQGSNSSSSSSNAGWVNKPAGTMVFSLLAGSFVMLFL